MRVPDIPKCHLVLTQYNSEEIKRIINEEIYNKIYYLDLYYQIFYSVEIRPFDTGYSKCEVLENRNKELIFETLNDELIPYLINDINYEFHDILYIIKFLNKFRNSSNIIIKYITNISSYSMVTRQARSWRPENA